MNFKRTRPARTVLRKVQGLVMQNTLMRSVCSWQHSAFRDAGTFSGRVRAHRSLHQRQGLSLRRRLADIVLEGRTESK